MNIVNISWTIIDYQGVPESVVLTLVDGRQIVYRRAT